MLENTISINSGEAFDGLQENTAQETEESSLQKNEDVFTASEETSDEKGQVSSEEETISEDEEMLTLTVYGNEITVPKSEAVNAAQKGIAFDSIKQKYFLAKEDARLKALEGLAQVSGKSIPQLIGDMTKETLLNQLADRYGELDSVPFEELEEAMHKVYQTKKDVQLAADRLTMAEKQNQLEEFLQHNPGCTDIPPEVIARAKKGENLSFAYSQYQISQLTQQLERAQRELSVLKSSKAAKEKSMPSAKSTVAGGSTKSMYGMMKSLW